MADISLKYSDVRDECHTLQSDAESLKETYEAISELKSSCNSAWKGDASEAYQNELGSFWKHIQDAQKTVATSVLFMGSCIDGYESLDNDAVISLNNLIELAGGKELTDLDTKNAPQIDLNSRVSNTYGKSKEEPTRTNNNSSASTGSQSYSGGNSGGRGYSGGYSGGGSSIVNPIVNDIVDKVADNQGPVDVTSFPIKSDEELRAHCELPGGLIGGMPIPLYIMMNYNCPIGESGTKNLSSSGCGMVSLAMIESYLLGREILPTDIAPWAGQKPYYFDNGGADPCALALNGPGEHGLVNAIKDVQDPASILEALKNNQPILLSTGNKEWTKGAHIVVLRGLDDNGNVLVNDPSDSFSWKNNPYIKDKAYPIEEITKDIFHAIIFPSKEQVQATFGNAVTPEPTTEETTTI